MVHVLDEVLIILDQNHSCLLILLDLSSAFDTVNHNTLSLPLGSRMGLLGTVLSWFQSFLSDRSQRVKVANLLSELVPISMGLPQGSTISPTLFNLYIEPLMEILNNSNIFYHIYAYDTQLYLKISTPDGMQTVNQDLLNTQ